jgi:hypothetical protein
MAATSAPDVARLAAARAVESYIAKPPENAIGALNRIATNKVAGPNLSETFGAGAADTYREAIRNEMRRANTAKFLDSGSNSATFRRADADAAVGVPNLKLHPLGLLNSVWSKVARGSALTDTEKEAIARVGTSTVGGPEGLDLDQFTALGTPVSDLLGQVGLLGAPAGAEGAARYRRDAY